MNKVSHLINKAVFVREVNNLGRELRLHYSTHEDYLHALQAQAERQNSMFGFRSICTSNAEIGRGDGDGFFRCLESSVIYEPGKDFIEAIKGKRGHICIITTDDQDDFMFVALHGEPREYHEEKVEYVIDNNCNKLEISSAYLALVIDELDLGVWDEWADDNREEGCVRQVFNEEEGRAECVRLVKAGEIDLKPSDVDSIWMD